MARCRPSASLPYCGRSVRGCARLIKSASFTVTSSPPMCSRPTRGGLCDVVKLVDFGLVKPVGENPSVSLSQEGGISGTPLFMSPEQARGQSDLDGRSDIYSLGAVAFALLIGRPPFDGTNPTEVIIAHARDEVVWPPQHEVSVPADLKRVILRCLAKRREDRFPGCRQSGASPRRVCRRRPVDRVARRSLVAGERRDRPGVAYRRRDGSRLESTLRWAGLLREEGNDPVGMTARSLARFWSSLCNG